MKLFALALMAAALPALAQDRYRDNQDLRHDYRQSDRLRADIARDQYRLDQAYRLGRYREANAIRRDLERDQRKLYNLNRDIRHDQRDRYDDRGH